jgi:hypothetical protein
MLRGVPLIDARRVVSGAQAGPVAKLPADIEA